MRNKYVAAILAFFLGIFGVHRFYLGQRFAGMLYFLFFVFGFIIITTDAPGAPPLIAIPAILGFIDSVLLAVMPQQNFDERYNRKWIRLEQQSTTRAPEAYALPSENETVSAYKRKGVEKFRAYDFEGAIAEFQQVLRTQPNDAATHFNIACCYAVLERKSLAFQHLSMAVTYGFKHLEKISTHDALAYLRTQPEYADFVANGYQYEPNQANMLTLENAAPVNDLLDQIIKLGELRDRGILTEEEFTRHKEKILSQR